MIFKVNFSSLSSVGKRELYVSLCENKLYLNRIELHYFLYKFLIDKKIINFEERRFSCEINNSNVKTIKCFLTKDRAKAKVFCTLKQLVKPIILEQSFLNAKAQLLGMINKQVTADIWAQEDAAIFAELNAVHAADRVNIAVPVQRYTYQTPIRRSLDYQGIARRTLIIDELPEGALPYYDLDIDVAPGLLDDEDE